MHRLLALLLTTMLLSGCQSAGDEKYDNVPADYRPFVQQIEYPQACQNQPVLDGAAIAPPPTLRNFQNLEQWPLSLSEAVQLALMNSEVMQDIGGRVVSSPDTVGTVFDPAVQETNPRFGVEAALSNFDAQVATRLMFNRNENKFNNLFAAGFAGAANNTANFNMELSKVAATGTRFTIRNLTDYDRRRPNPTVNRFPSFYTTFFQAEVRQPLLQGSGVEFNRIAGPFSLPGVYNGVLVARINNDITLHQFERAVRDLLRDVEQTYWQLYFGYRELDTRQRARQAAALIWRQEKLRLDAGQARPDDEAQARQRYYVYQTQVEDALAGGAQVGGFGGIANLGVFGAERQLRRLLGLPPADGRIIRPTTEPTLAEVVYEWSQSVTEALQRRVELRQQRWLIRRRELELLAARNYNRPRLDFVGQYGVRGYGDNLFGGRYRTNPAQQPGSAFADIVTADLQDWGLGLELTAPVGNRIGQIAVRNAQLQLTRDRAVERTQELQVTHELASAIAQMERTMANVRSTYNRRQASAEEVRVKRARAGETDPLNFVLDALQRAADDESAYNIALVQYNLALLDVEFRRGTLLSYMDVSLTEGPWSQEAHRSAAKQSRNFEPRRPMRIAPDVTPVSRGPYPQQRPLDMLPMVEPIVVEELPMGEDNSGAQRPAPADPGAADPGAAPPQAPRAPAPPSRIPPPPIEAPPGATPADRGT